MRSSWTRGARVGAHEKLDLRIAVVQQNVELLPEKLAEVSDPQSSRYGHYLSFDEVVAYTADREATAAVLRWLAAEGLSAEALPSQEWVLAKGVPVARAESLLSCELHRYSAEGAPEIVRAERVAFPDAVAQSVAFVSDLTYFPPAARQVVASSSVSSSGTVTPALLKDYYNILDTTVANANATQSVFETGNYFNPDDLKDFHTLYGTQGPAVTTIGRNSPDTCVSYEQYCHEATLDIEFMTGLAQAPTTFWEMESSSNVFEEWILAVANAQTVPLVHSVSYGQLESQTTPEIMQRFDTEAMKLGLRGVSVIVASGDDGVAGVTARSSSANCGINPGFPASSPHVTVVGGTQGPEDGNAEVGCSASTGGVITSGGGFSGVFPRPGYQAAQVQEFLDTSAELPPSTEFASAGRAYPDVAVLAHNYAQRINRGEHVNSGTSASAPVFAAMITLINDARMSAGKPALGFLNPALYAAASTFRDITSGENRCTCSPGPCCQHGFAAQSGWDPVTGLGSVHFPALLQALMGDTPAPPPPAPTPTPPTPTPTPTPPAPTPSPTPPAPAPTPAPTPPAPTPAPTPPSPVEGECVTQQSQEACGGTAQQGEVCTWCDFGDWGDCMPPNFSCTSQPEVLV